MKKSKPKMASPKPKLTEDGYIVKVGDTFVFNTLSVDRAYAKSRLPGWTAGRVVKIKIIEQ